MVRLESANHRQNSVVSLKIPDDEISRDSSYHVQHGYTSSIRKQNGAQATWLHFLRLADLLAIGTETVTLAPVCHQREY